MLKTSLDLHPEKLPGKGPETALLAAREFLEQALKAGQREVRLITGLGLHGDGTPRLRGRVEQDVLPAFFSQIESSSYEQGGAVILLRLRHVPVRADPRYLRQRRHEDERSRAAGMEQRLEVAWERLEAAETALQEGGLKRARLKLNQVAREFGWTVLETAVDLAAAGAFLKESFARLEALDR